MTLNIWELLGFIIFGSSVMSGFLLFTVKMGVNLFAEKFRETWRKESEKEITQLKSHLDQKNQLLLDSL